jgi:hypothetical protein
MEIPQIGDGCAACVNLGASDADGASGPKLFKVRHAPRQSDPLGSSRLKSKARPANVIWVFCGSPNALFSCGSSKNVPEIIDDLAISPKLIRKHPTLSSGPPISLLHLRGHKRKCLARFYFNRSRSYRRRWIAGPDLGERWPSRLVATASESRLNIRHNAHVAVIELPEQYASAFSKPCGAIATLMT